MAMAEQLASMLRIDEANEVERICNRLRRVLGNELHRRGFVVAISGGIDSAVCSALAVRAIGKERVFGLLLPERDSSDSSTDRGLEIVKSLGVAYEKFDIAPALEALGCYRWRDQAIQGVFPEYGAGWKSKIVIGGGHAGTFNFFKLVVQSPSGEVQESKLDSRSYLQIVAATNFKQRVRKTMEYCHADRLNYAVIGTPNRLEYDQGFFVKNGDGSADVKPIAHLYKGQVYSLAKYLQLPASVCNARPTTDTYSMAQGQDEFYFALPYEQMDIALLARNIGAPASRLAAELGISEDHANHIYRDIDVKRRTTAVLHWQGITVDPVEGPMTSPRYDAGTRV